MFVRDKFLRNNRPLPIEFLDFFKSDKFYEFFGFSFFNREVHKLQKIRRALFKISHIFIPIMITHLLLTIIIDETLDVVALFENLAFVGGFVLILHGTVLILYVNRLKVGKIIENLEMHFPHHILDQYNFDTNKHLQLLKKHSFAIFYSMGSMVIVFCLMPIFVQIYGRVTGNEQSLSTIVHLSFPFDQMQHGLYEIVYFYQAFITIIGVSLLVMNDMLFCSIVELTAMEFDIIADVLSEINVEDEAEKELKGLIDIHQQLLEVVKKINEIFSPLMLINVLGVTTIACFSAFFCVVKKFKF